MSPGGDPPPPPAPDQCLTVVNLSPEELLAHVDTLVVLCMENRSFDHYLGALRLEGRSIEGLDGTESNPDADGAEQGVYRLLDFTNEDLPHTWDEIHRQWNEGAMNGFVTEAGPDAPHTMGYFTREELPQLYELADQGVVCDRWFCSLLGPTWPNRYYLHCGTSNGRRGNLPAIPIPRSIWDVLDEAGIEGVNYFHDVPWKAGGLLELDSDPIEEFFDRAAAGTLPSYCLIDPGFIGAAANDDHPAHDVRLGQALIASVVAALAASPQWERSLFVLTYDEHGGFYDHVPPPSTVDPSEEHAQMGVRVPSVVVGPKVRSGCRVGSTLEHCSILRTLEVRHGLSPLTERTAASRDLSICIDPEKVMQKSRTSPRPRLTPVQVSLGKVRRMQPDPGRHAELREAADRMRLPPDQDRRSRSIEIAERVLRHGERLGAVELLP